MTDYFRKRRDKVRKALRKQHLDAALITSETNVTWLTGFTGDDSYLLLLPERDILLSDSRYGLQIAQECPGLEVAIRGGKTGLLDLVKSLLPKMSGLGTLRLAVEKAHVTLALAEAIQAKLSVELASLAEGVESFRQIKDRQEIALLREAARIARNAFHAMRASLTPDKTEKQIADEMEHTMRLLGATRAGFPTIVAAGANAAMCHAVPGSTRVGEADFLLVDWGAEYRGYTSDLTRTFVTGKETPKFRKLYRIVRDAQAKAIDAIRPGIPCCDIDKVARDYIAECGYGACFGHGLGHGIGLQIHERPAFSPTCTTLLEPGMVLTVEPGVYLPRWGGIRIEDDILVTRDGCEVLTDVEK